MVRQQQSRLLTPAIIHRLPTPIPLTGWPKGPGIEAQAAVLMDVNTEAVLYSKNADTQLYPASITKILTTLLACENHER